MFATQQPPDMVPCGSRPPTKTPSAAGLKAKAAWQLATQQVYPNTNSPSVTVQLIKSSHCEIPLKKRGRYNILVLSFILLVRLL